MDPMFDDWKRRYLNDIKYFLMACDHDMYTTFEFCEGIRPLKIALDDFETFLHNTGGQYRTPRQKEYQESKLKEIFELSQTLYA